MAQHQQSFQLPKIPVGRRVVSIAVQLKCGEREEDVDVIGYFCQWGTPKPLRALWPVNTHCAPGLFQNLSLDTRTLCYSVGAKDCCSLCPKWNVAVGWCLAESAEGLKQKLLLRCEVPPFLWAAWVSNCWTFYQDHSSFLISSSLFCPFFHGPGACCAACSVLPTFCAGFAVQSRDSWINTAPSQGSWLQLSSALFSLLESPRCLLCSFWVQKISVSFFPVGIKPQIKPEVLDWALRGFAEAGFPV